MKITKLNTFILHDGWRNLILVELETDSGLTGLGEATLANRTEAVVAYLHAAATKHVIGADPFDIEAIWRRMYLGDFIRGGMIACAGLSAVDIACLGAALPSRRRRRMIVDVHSHAMRYPEHLSDNFVREADRARGFSLDLTLEFEDYQAAMQSVDKCILFGMKARHTGFYVPNDWIAAFAARDPEKIIPFMSLDPTEPDYLADFEHAYLTLKMRGIKLAPMYANFDPSDKRLDILYTLAAKHHLPILFHAGTTFCQYAPLKFTRPALWDDVAMRHPDLVMVMAHLGHPFENEALVTARKHPNVYLDLSALYYRPWQLYNSLVLAQEYHVIPKILFGSDYPFATPSASLDGLYALNIMVAGTNLPRVSETALDQIIHQDSLKLLGLM